MCSHSFLYFVSYDPRTGARFLHAGPGAQLILDLLFVYNCLLLDRATIWNSITLVRIMKNYFIIFGQKINLMKNTAQSEDQSTCEVGD